MMLIAYTLVGMFVLPLVFLFLISFLDRDEQRSFFGEEDELD